MVINQFLKKLMRFWPRKVFSSPTKDSNLPGQKLNFPRKIGSRFLIFWAKVLVSPLYIAQVIRETLQERRKPRKNTSNGLNTREYLITPYWKRKQSTARGFILPTVTMVLLVFSLVVSSLLLRTSQQTQQVAGTRATQATYNIATPAIDRAKSKLEFIFKRDPRFIGVPNETAIERWLINPATARTGWVGYSPYLDETEQYVQIYDLPGETRIDINGDNLVDNAWAYNTDIDGDGTTETVAYSILVKHQNLPTNPTVTLDSSDANKAANLVTRSGPLSIQSADNSSTCSRSQTPDSGWYPINTATVRKNFQINVVVVNRNAANRAVTSAELQQDRQLDTGNKWGVWFRYDLEAFPGPDFNWNGAMHTDGNIMWGDTNGNDVGISAYLVSSPSSCLYTQDSSEITMTQAEDRSGTIVFQGQVINTSPANNDFRGRSQVDLFPSPGIAPSGSTTPPSRALNLAVSTNTASSLNGDSVRDNLQTSSPYQFSLDPIPLYTEDRSFSRYTVDRSNLALRDPNWNDNPLSRRMLNKLVRRPYVDDAYRADDRWGPKPTYTDAISVPNRAAYGVAINSNVDLLTREDPLAATPEDVGLDGYWERRARVQGLRVIVGQRLELGNTFGWMGNNDPLYPPNTNLTNLVRQRKSVRDNLAAVQSTLIYHYDSQENSENGRDFPVATLASTVHNGTSVIRDQSRTFTNLRDTNQVNADFLNGVGTNGWEFNAPGNVTNQADFAALVDQSTDPLRIALTNLSRFAGETRGAFPPRQETSGTIVHPYPLTSMWGDFSNLRRALNSLNTVAYADLSLADRTTIQTAAATIGLLAYNLDNAKRVYNASGRNGLMALGEHLWQLVDGNPANDEINLLMNPPVPFPAGYQRERDAANFYAQFTAEDFINGIYRMNGLGNQENREELVERAKLISNLSQIDRDRTLGFVSNRFMPPVTGSTSGWSSTTGEVTVGNGANTNVLKTSCDPDTFSDVLGTAPGVFEKKVGLAMAFCSASMGPKYPALYYLFPKQSHDQIGNNFDGAGTSVTNPSDDQPTTEEFIADTYIFNPSPTVTTDINHNFIYRVIGDADSNGRENGAENGIATLALQPRIPTAWRLPHTTTNTGTENSINDNGTTRYLAFLDKAFYNGRQLMQERVLDIDLNLLRTTRPRTGGDFWMSQLGIIYAFREDALREDGLLRPQTRSFESCNDEAELLTANCSMVTNPTTPQDPPNSSASGISAKPVDFYPDPDRRSHGFRLKNGSDISRVGTEAGFSFISDNPVYIQGNLNIHQRADIAITDPPTLVEEFTQILESNWSNFYTRSTRNDNFARPDRDRWRPVEVLGDALTILSNNFCDGTMEDGFRNNDASCPSGRVSSYRNSVLAWNSNNSAVLTGWHRENAPNLASGDTLSAPIRPDRNGVVRRDNANFTQYRSLSQKTIGAAVTSRVNAIFINGLVPSRPNQSYGGLHNFPRFLENWGGDDLHITGAFVQLNFSTYATAPWDQEAWEPGETPPTGENIGYYSPPNRRWGYDVALQYVRPGPIANRFVSVGSPRNEFYKQIPADDPYSRQLRCSRVGTNGPRVDPNATDCT
jgi:type II secretory pathway pseudopilin PulG